MKHTTQRFGLRMGLLTVAAIALFVPACAQENRTAEAPEAPAEVSPDVSINQVSGSLEDFVGQTLTLRGKVEPTEDLTTFKLNDSNLLGGGEVLVINATGEPLKLPIEGEIEVQVTGDVRQFSAAEAQQQYGIDTQSDDYKDFENKPALFAQSVTLVPAPEELTENPQSFYNQPIVVEGNVADVASPSIFTMNDEKLFGGEDILVLNTAPGQAVEDGKDITMTGELRPFNAQELEQEYNLTWDPELRNQLESEYQNKPVFIAREVYPSQPQ